MRQFAVDVDRTLGEVQLEHLDNITDASKQKIGAVNWQASAWILERRWPDEYCRRTEQVALPVDTPDRDYDQAQVIALTPRLAKQAAALNSELLRTETANKKRPPKKELA